MLKSLLSIFCALLFLLGCCNAPHTPTEHHTPLYTKAGTRLQLVASRPGTLNLLMVPGGPGMDSAYLRSLAEILHIPGNIWLVDLPGNGNNAPALSSYAHWPKELLHAAQSFDHVVVLGHSFGGSMILGEPALDHAAKALILLDASPNNNVGKTPDAAAIIERYNQAPSDAACIQALQEFAPYNFTPDFLPQGRVFLQNAQCSHSVLDWHMAHHLRTYHARYVPTIPTLILAGREDELCPPQNFVEDRAFTAPNIQQIQIPHAGHYPWLEQPAATAHAIEAFLRSTL